MVDTATRTIQLPVGQVLMDRTGFSAEQLMLLEKDLKGGTLADCYLQLDREDATELLLMYRGAVHSAIRVTGGEPGPMPLAQLFGALSREPAKRARLCRTDTGLLLLIAVAMHNRPTIRAPSHILDLQKLLAELRERGQSCVLCLARGAERNLVFFKAGVGSAIYFVDKAHAVGRTIPEQIIYYCRQLAAAPATVSVYYDLRSSRDENAHRPFADLLAGKTGPAPFLLQLVFAGKPVSKRLIQSGRCTVGRDPANDLVIDHLSISRHHCVFEWKGGLEVADAGSANGTFVHGRRIDRMMLKPSDRVRIGEYDVLYGEELDSGPRSTLETLFIGTGPAAKDLPKAQIVGKAGTVSIDRPVFTIGSAKDANLRVTGFRVRPIQATIVREPKGDFRILGAPGGRTVTVGGQRIADAGALLTDGSEIAIGRHKLLFKTTLPAIPAPPTPPST